MSAGLITALEGPLDSAVGREGTDRGQERQN